jgi:hypothetical protein
VDFHRWSIRGLVARSRTVRLLRWPAVSNNVIQTLADTLVLGSVLEQIHQRFGPYQLVDHWQQGEFHHDVIVRISGPAPILPGPILVVSTNCNGGVKEILCFHDVPDRGALWHWRCPHVTEFSGSLPPIIERAITHHWVDPCELLAPDARSELKAAHRRRQAGGGWEMISAAPKF